MILIYAHTSPIRLQYICQFIFKEQLGTTYSLTVDAEGFENHDGPKINYSDFTSPNPIGGFKIKTTQLLFENDIKAQATEFFDTTNYKAFFKTEQSDFSFDIFAATFYLISRYEEYLPHDLDVYGRYSHQNSLAFKEGFLNTPLVNIWLADFAATLKKKFPSISLKLPAFNFLPTYDIDIAWSYKSKGLIRNIGGFLKAPSASRIRVLLGLNNDPFDSYLFLDALHDKYKIQPIYFFLVATWGSLYDKNISPYSSGMWQLIKRHAKKYSIGVHPSWKSNDNVAIIKKEKKILEAAGDTQITKSRQHYIKLALPKTYENLIDAGVLEDYTMGYGSINGFRASVASSYSWYNLTSEKITALRLYPFCFMDANCFYEQKQDSPQAYDEMLYYYHACQKVGGQMITIFHNNFLGTDKQFAGWKDMYEKFIAQAQQ
jgi:hypothetical protein